MLTTLLLSGTVVLGVGVLLLDQVSRDLVEAARRGAVAEAEAGLDYLRGQLRAAGPGRAGAEAAVDAAASTLVRRGAEERYELVLLSTSVGTSGRQSRDVDPASIPASLREAVSAGESAYAFVRLTRGQDASGTRHSGPGLAVGAPVAGPYGAYQLYHLFPLTEQAETLDLVRRWMLLGGLLLVLLLAAIAHLVARTVVTPVRNAARTAQRLADGLLDERMDVRGEDDLARLAVSFNSMAGSLQRQIVQLEELSRLQQRFVSDVSHELRTPLTTVRMAADVLHAAREDFPAAVARSAELLQTELDRFERLLADLLEISRHDAGAADLDLDPVDLRPIAQRVAETTSALGTPGALELALPDEPVIAEVDARRVERILRNLVVNALEHGEGRRVTVRVAGGGDAVAVSVRDRGIGLRPGEAEQVFGRFWRGDPSRARRTGGTGLGLSIAQEDARLHGGRLEAWGEPGRGSVFRLTLPVRTGAVAEPSPLPLVPDGLDDAAGAGPPPAAGEENAGRVQGLPRGTALSGGPVSGGPVSGGPVNGASVSGAPVSGTRESGR